MNRDIARILDANFNRAREALRVIEEAARFAADDASLSGEIKQLRHDLASTMKQLDADALLEARNTSGDVGTTIATASERTRESIDAVVVSACKRLVEALRVLEEYGKTEDVDFAADIERLRYRSYDMETRVRFESARRVRWAEVRLYVLITEALCSENWLTTARHAIAGGAGALQLREKDLPDAELLRRAQALRELTRETNTLLILNDRPDIARLVDADGVHVGQDDLPVRAVRRVAGPRCIIGRSTHTIEQARAAMAEGADHVAVGPMFPTSTKPQDHIAGADTLRAVLAELDRPHVAIGGISADNVSQLVEVGCRCVAVCSAVVSQPDVEAAARAIRATLP